MHNDSAALLRSPRSLPILSLDYLIALLPLIVWSVRFNGARALCLALVGMVFSVVWETLLEGLLRRRITVWDGSAALEGLIFALLLPANASYLFVIIGTLFANVCFKTLLGGQGKCPIHPAIGAYALLAPFVSRSFTYGAFGEHFPVFHASPAGSVAQTTLASLSDGAVPSASVVSDMIGGFLPGNMGQLSLLLLLGSAVYLFVRGRLSFLQTACAMGSAFLLSLLLPASPLASDAIAIRYAFLQVGCGSLLFLTVIPASYPAFAPYTKITRIIFGLGIGVITVLIRYFGLAPDGAVYAVLLMQASLPLLKRFVRPRHYAQN